MLREGTSKRTVELRGETRAHYALEVFGDDELTREIHRPQFDADNRTRELYRPGIDAPFDRYDLPDRTMELTDCDLEAMTRVLTQPRSISQPPPTPDGDVWSLDALVDDDVTLTIDDFEETSPQPLVHEHRGFLWRLFFRFGWVSA